MIKVKVDNDNRTVEEMYSILTWVIETFYNEMDPDRWRYGRDTQDPYGSELLNGPWEIEYFEFRDEKDANWFRMMYG